MTPTTTEREARELLAREYERDGQDFVARCLRYEPDVTTLERRSIRAIIAALTREQREGDGIEGWQRALVDSVHRWREHPQQEAQGAAAQKNPFFMQIEAFNAWHDETYPSPCDAEQRGLWQGRRSQRYATWNAAIAWFKTTQPAPVDVRALRAVADKWERWVVHNTTDEGEAFRHCASDLRALLDGQPAGVDDPPVALLVSMAVCLNHGFGLLDMYRQQSMLADMRKLWLEVVGRGYYMPEREGFYTAMLVKQGDGAALTDTAALTREQREGERRSTHRVFRELSSVTESLPCYCEATSDHLVGREHPQQEAQGAVAYARCKHDRWADQCLRCNPQATPPAPVDVRVAELIAADKEYDEAASYAAYVKDPVGNGARKAAATKRRAAALALLDGQPAGVECKWVGAMRGDGKCPQCSQYHALGGGGGRS